MSISEKLPKLNQKRERKPKDLINEKLLKLDEKTRRKTNHLLISNS